MILGIVACEFTHNGALKVLRKSERLMSLTGVIFVFRFAQNRMHLGITQASLVLHSVFTVFV